MFCAWLVKNSITEVPNVLKSGRPTKTAPFEVINAANCLHESGLPECAVELLCLTLEEQPDDGRLWETLGMVYHDMRKFDRAIGALRRASLLCPLGGAARFALAQCFNQREQQMITGERNDR